MLRGEDSTIHYTVAEARGEGMHERRAGVHDVHTVLSSHHGDRGGGWRVIAPRRAYTHAANITGDHSK